MRPRTNRADLLSPLEYIAKLSAEAEKNTDPLPATKPIALKWESATPDLELSFAFPRTTLSGPADVTAGARATPRTLQRVGLTESRELLRRAFAASPPGETSSRPDLR
jgi:hypothetical protein